MSLKSVMAFPEQSKKLKKFLEKREGLFGKKVKNWKMCSKSVMVFLETN